MAAGVPVAQTVAICDGLYAVTDVVEKVRNTGDIVAKPANASGGDGILVLGSRQDDGWRASGGRLVTDDDLEQHLANIVFGAYAKELDDRAFIEERIFAHPKLQSWSPDGLCDVRLLFLRGEPLMAMLRVPTRVSGGRANLHQGGVGVAIDLATGRTTRAVVREQVTDVHPDTGAELVGYDLPDWEQTLEVGRRAAGCVPLGYLGVDIVLDADRGPLVLEMNARPGLEIQNVNGRFLGPKVDRVLA